MEKAVRSCRPESRTGTRVQRKSNAVTESSSDGGRQRVVSTTAFTTSARRRAAAMPRWPHAGAERCGPTHSHEAHDAPPRVARPAQYARPMPCVQSRIGVAQQGRGACEIPRIVMKRNVWQASGFWGRARQPQTNEFVFADAFFVAGARKLYVLELASFCEVHSDHSLI